jgi:cell fate (sporulation/competence/biofilm development) regulator YlbF (YheA/YmcA/DUF963 family)
MRSELSYRLINAQSAHARAKGQRHLVVGFFDKEASLRQLLDDLSSRGEALDTLCARST